MAVWDADVDLDESIAQAVLDRRFPQIAPVWLTQIGVGWDNHAYLVNERHVFRIPHRRAAADLVRTEVIALRRLKGLLPLAIPEVEFFAEPDEHYPYPIMGYPHLPGTIASDYPLTDDLRVASAAPVARFLRTLHATPTDSVPPIPGDELRRADMSYRLPIVKKKIERLGASLATGPEILDTMEELSQGPGPSHAVWVHGDLYPRHLLVDDSGTVTSVIDWGDVHWGDPAIDLAIAFMFLPPSAWPDFRHEYGGIPNAEWNRARFRALTHAVYLFEYGLDTGSESVLRESSFTLENAIQ